MIYLLFLSFPLLHLFETLNNLLLLVPGLVNSYKNLKSKIFAAIQVFCVVWSMVLETSEQDTPDTLPVAAHIYTPTPTLFLTEPEPIICRGLFSWSCWYNHIYSWFVYFRRRNITSSYNVYTLISTLKVFLIIIHQKFTDRCCDCLQ